MLNDSKSVIKMLIDFCVGVCTQVRAAFVIGIPDEDVRAANRLIDPDFERWLSGDPLVINNPASQYGDKKPGYATRNGRGSMEIGAVKD